MIILGVVAFFIPVQTFLGIGWVVGALMAIHGIELAIVGFSREKKDTGKGVLGILVAIVGFIILFSGIQRLLTDMMIVYLAGIAVIVFGIYQIVNGVKNYQEEKSKSILNIVIGVLSIILGLVLVAHPLFTMVSLGYMIAAVILMQGIDMIILALHLEKKDKNQEGKNQ